MQFSDCLLLLSIVLYWVDDQQMIHSLTLCPAQRAVWEQTHRQFTPCFFFGLRWFRNKKANSLKKKKKKKNSLLCMLFSYTSVLIHVRLQLWINVCTNSYVHLCMCTLIKEMSADYSSKLFNFLLSGTNILFVISPLKNMVVNIPLKKSGI